MIRQTRDSSRNSSDLQDALRALPREGAPHGFTGQVLARVHRHRATAAGRPLWVSGPMLAVAGGVFLLVVGVGLVLQASGTERESSVAADPAVTAGRGPLEAGNRAGTAARLRELQSEQQRLLADAQRLRDEIEGEEGVIYLGGDDSIDFVLDLGELARSRAPREGAPRVMPASGGVNDRRR